MNHSGTVGFILIAVIYVIAAIIGIALFLLCKDWQIYGRVLIGDVAANVFIYWRDWRSASCTTRTRASRPS